MDFQNRIKKEMSEAIVRAIFEDAGYRVIDSGIEKFIRELAAMEPLDYAKLAFPEPMRLLPDFTILTKAQDEKYLIEVKYRKAWGKDLFDEIEPQVRHLGEMILVSVNAGADDPKEKNHPSRYIRCCALRIHDGVYQMHQRRPSRRHDWVDVADLRDGSGLWWSMTPLSEKFPKLREAENQDALFLAVQALGGILTP